MTNIEKERAALAGAATPKSEQNHHNKSRKNGKQYNKNDDAPVFSQVPPETDKTYSPSNSEFLEGIDEMVKSVSGALDFMSLKFKA